jgi:hypothetical protein
MSINQPRVWAELRRIQREIEDGDEVVQDHVVLIQDARDRIRNLHERVTKLESARMHQPDDAELRTQLRLVNGELRGELIAMVHSLGDMVLSMVPLVADHSVQLSAQHEPEAPAPDPFDLGPAIQAWREAETAEPAEGGEPAENPDIRRAIERIRSFAYDVRAQEVFDALWRESRGLSPHDEGDPN